MKIGKYPVKRTYRIPRMIADVLSLGLVVLIVSATFTFFKNYEDFYSMFDMNNPAAVETLLKNDPNYEWKQHLAWIFPVLALAVLVVYIVLVLKNHKLSSYDVNKRNAQNCYDAYAFGVSLCKIPALMIVFDMMCVAQDKLLNSMFGLSWFSWLTLLCVVLILIIIRYTSHRLVSITAKPQTAKSDAVQVKAVVAKKEDKAEENENTEEEI